GDDDSRCTGEAAQAAGGGGVVATPLVVDEDASPVVSREMEATPGKRMHLRGRGWRRCTVVAGGAAGGRPAPEREKEKAGRGGAATGERRKGLKLENGPRGFHFIGWGREPGTGEVGTAAEKSAGGHGKRSGLARAFRVIKSTNQGGNMGERERNKWVLLPPI
uniref:Uncharacterized protein n=1 Tax=Oryza glaberrima TaxID=4538 RepID=I1R946_ORYGL